MKDVPIKFRARRMTDGKYVYGQYFEQIGADGKIYGEIVIEYTYNKKVYEYVFKDTVSQLVGYDGDGKEIYEGDELTYTEYIEEDEEYEDEIEYKGKAYLAFRLVGDMEPPPIERMGAKLEYWYKE